MQRTTATALWVVLVGAVALWVALPNCFRWYYRGRGHRNQKVIMDIRAIERALEEHAAEHGGAYPDELDALLTPDEEGCTSLGRESLPLDPWLNPYAYEPPRDGRPLRVISYGSDGAPGGRGTARDIDSLILASGNL